MTFSTFAARARRLALPVLAISVSGMVLAGCMAGPTYGTGKGSNEQLLEDVTGILSVGPKSRPQIDYKPRPELVKPADIAGAQLPPPQDSIATSSNPAWPEAPEARLARLRAEATAGRDDPDFDPEVSSGITPASAQAPMRRTRGDDLNADGSVAGTEAQRKEFNRRMAMSNQGSPTTRRYLSEPPLAYRQAAETAATGDVGEDEWKKERRQKRAARKKGTGGWRDILPW